MRDDGPGRIPQCRGKRVDIGTRQGCGGDRDVMVDDPLRFGGTPRVGGRKLSRIFAIGAVVDDRPHARFGERIDVRAVEAAGDVYTGRQWKQLGWHSGPPRSDERRVTAGGADFTKKYQAANWGGRCTTSPARIQNRSRRRSIVAPSCS